MSAADDLGDHHRAGQRDHRPDVALAPSVILAEEHMRMGERFRRRIDVTSSYSVSRPSIRQDAAFGDGAYGLATCRDGCATT